MWIDVEKSMEWERLVEVVRWVMIQCYAVPSAAANKSTYAYGYV